jgi:2-amino-4-hydroxy-6-hydroxymethyldihydropteridine diphosphokinase
MGSPAGPPAATLRAAFDALSAPGVEVVAASRLYATPCMPAGAGPDYVNAVAQLSTTLGPEALMAWLHGIEQRFDRQRTGRWAARSLDLDLLDHGGRVLPDLDGWRAWADLPPERQREVAPQGLVLPHPRMAERAFVLVPLAEIAPDWRHPVTGQTAAAMRDALPAADLAAIRPLAPSEGGLAFQPGLR